jgi:hypothetical protein
MKNHTNLLVICLVDRDWGVFDSIQGLVCSIANQSNSAERSEQIISQ